MTQMDYLTLGLASYAAILATLGIVLNIKRWRSDSPRLAVEVRTGVVILDEATQEKTKVISVAVVNVGRGRTVIDGYSVAIYKSSLHWLLKRPFAQTESLQAVSSPVPSTLEHNDEWNQTIPENLPILQAREAKHPYLFISHSPGVTAVPIRFSHKS